MVAELSYIPVSDVVESWEELKRKTKNYEEVAGTILFRRLFKLDPTAQNVFSYGGDEDLSEDLFETARIKKHARFFIQMIDRALGLLGPDIDLLTDILFKLGKKHAAFGVKVSHYPNMGRALLETLEELIGDSFTEDVRDSWLIVYQALSDDLIQAHNSQYQSIQ